MAQLAKALKEDFAKAKETKQNGKQRNAMTINVILSNETQINAAKDEALTMFPGVDISKLRPVGEPKKLKDGGLSVEFSVTE